MAFRQQFTDASGVVHQVAYWRPSTISIDIPERSIVFVFRAWRDKVASEVGLSPTSGTRIFRVSGDAFAVLMARHTAPGGPNLQAMLYQYAKANDPFFIDAQSV